jgi:nucleoside-diphosphate-sugar epimerase
MKIFLAGGTGVIGKRLIPVLIKAGHKVVALNLSPTERAVFLLREVFDYDYSEVAQLRKS